MASINSYPKANDSGQTPKIGDVNDLKRKAVDDSETDLGGAPKKSNVAQTNVQIEQPAVPKSVRINHTKLFSTDLKFKSSDEALAWAIRVGKENGTVIVKFRFAKGVLWMYCERHGSVTFGMNSWSRAKEDSKRCSCPFRLKCCRGDRGGKWEIEVVCGTHNHEIDQSLQGNPNGTVNKEKNELTKELFASKCKPKQIQQVPREVPIQVDWGGTRFMHPSPEIDREGVYVKPKQITPQIKDKDVVTAITCEKVSGPSGTLWVEDLGGRSVLQHFLSQTLVANQFCYKWHREAPGTDGRSSDLVFSHTDSLALLRAFPSVLIIDATFQGNRFNTPFFEVRGVASTWENFNVACAFVAAEREDNYVWALNHLNDLCSLAGKMPTTIVTVSNPDQALFNAVERVFPDSKHLLCRHHIYNIIKDRCLKDTCPTLFLSACKALFESKMENVYEERLASLENDWKSKKELVGYLKQTWLTPHKDKIVSAWTDKVMHFGSHDTERVESRVKAHLVRSGGSNVWGKLYSLLCRQTEEINESFEKSQKILPGFVPRIDGDPFRVLQHGISHKAIEIMAQEYKLVTSAVLNPRACVCQLTKTHGLPCAHTMAIYVAHHTVIPRDAIHVFWRQLNLEVLPDAAAGDKQTPTPENLLSSEGRLIKKPNVEEPCAAQGKPLEKQRGKPVAVIPENPSNKPNVLGPHIHEIPNFMVPYVTGFCEYAANEHSGFQAIAVADRVECGENGWCSVRGDLFKELASYPDLYATIFGSDTVKNTLKALAAWTTAPLPEQRLSLPDMGHIVATQYQRVFVVLGQQCTTFLPLDLVDEGDPSDSDLEELCLVSLEQGSKFISVTMEEGFPLPPVHPMWVRHHLTSVDGLDQRYDDRFEKYEWFQSFMGSST